MVDISAWGAFSWRPEASGEALEGCTLSLSCSTLMLSLCLCLLPPLSWLPQGKQLCCTTCSCPGCFCFIRGQGTAEEINMKQVNLLCSGVSSQKFCLSDGNWPYAGVSPLLWWVLFVLILIFLSHSPWWFIHSFFYLFNHLVWKQTNKPTKNPT